MREHILQWPEDAGKLDALHSGDIVYLSGTIYTARDAAHRRFVSLLQAGEGTPVDLRDSAIFYAGPSPLSSEYTVSKENDRMGYRLTGPAIEAAEGCDGNIISDGISFGAIQVPTDQPIIMMADHQTTGGYAKIAHVIAVDLPLVAQLKTGDTMRFRAVGVEEAQDLYLQRYQMLCETARHLNEDKISRKTENQVRINGQSFHVLVAELK